MTMGLFKKGCFLWSFSKKQNEKQNESWVGWLGIIIRSWAWSSLGIDAKKKVRYKTSFCFDFGIKINFVPCYFCFIPYYVFHPLT